MFLNLRKRENLEGITKFSNISYQELSLFNLSSFRIFGNIGLKRQIITNHVCCVFMDRNIVLLLRSINSPKKAHNPPYSRNKSVKKNIFIRDTAGNTVRGNNLPHLT